MDKIQAKKVRLMMMHILMVLEVILMVTVTTTAVAAYIDPVETTEENKAVKFANNNFLVTINDKEIEAGTAYIVPDEFFLEIVGGVEVTHVAYKIGMFPTVIEQCSGIGFRVSTEELPEGEFTLAVSGLTKHNQQIEWEVYRLVVKPADMSDAKETEMTFEKNDIISKIKENLHGNIEKYTLKPEM